MIDNRICKVKPNNISEDQNELNLLLNKPDGKFNRIACVFFGCFLVTFFNSRLNFTSK